MLYKLLLSFMLILGVAQIVDAQVSKGIHQVLEIDEENPKSLYIKVGTENVDVKRTPGSRIRVSGKVKISIPNVYFLEHLIEKGRYVLEVTPTGDGGVKLEDKAKTDIILRGEKCTEEVRYTIYIPHGIERVVFENSLTGISNVIVMN